MNIKSVAHRWDWRNWRTWSLAGLAVLLVIAAAYWTDLFGGSTLPDTGEVITTEPATE